MAGEQFDHCYHLACDTIDNVSREALDGDVDAVADAIFDLAASTETVNGVAGKPIPGPGPANVEIDGPQGTFLDGGGGLDHDQQATGRAVQARYPGDRCHPRQVGNAAGADPLAVEALLRT